MKNGSSSKTIKTFDIKGIELYRYGWFAIEKRVWAGLRHTPYSGQIGGVFLTCNLLHLPLKLKYLDVELRDLFF